MNIESCFKITYGLYVVSSAYENNQSGYISNVVNQVSSDPVMLAVACNKDNFTSSLINQSQALGVSIIQKDADAGIIGDFGFKTGKNVNKFENKEHFIGQSGSPILLKDTIAWFDCKVLQTVDVGTHLIYITNVLDAQIINNLWEPLTYSYYREFKKGKSPKNAPSYIAPDKITLPFSSNTIKYKCSVCDYLYDPANGDEMHGVTQGTSFEDLPEDWQCPVCGVDKSFFVKI